MVGPVRRSVGGLQARRHRPRKPGLTSPDPGYPRGVDMMIDADGDRLRWRLVRRTPVGADVLARAASALTDEQSCRDAVEALAAAPAEAMLTVQEPDGRWRWVVAGPDGAPLAESAGSFRDAAA